MDEVGVIRLNNTLGNDDLVTAFDEALDELSNTKGLIIDLRNTVFGGDSYEARGIMSRFIDQPRPYQKHTYPATSPNNPDVQRSRTEYATPRGKQYAQAVVVLVGRWTGSMGEGLAIGFEEMGRGEIVGSEMRRLAGEVYDFGFKHQRYGYKLSTTRLLHVDGTPREQYVPKNYVKQTTISEDETLRRGIELILAASNRPDSLLKRVLERIGKEDQALRLLFPEAMEKFGQTSDEYIYISSLIHHQDSICLNQVIQLIDTHGWIGKSKVGSEANQAIWLVIQHANLEIQEQYLPLLRASVQEGESEGWHLAFLEDRILMCKDEKQIYGTQAMWDNDLQKFKIHPIEDVKNVNKRRKELGMEPIEEYAESNGYVFDKKAH